MISNISLSGLLAAQYEVNKSASRIVNAQSVPAIEEEVPGNTAGIESIGLPSSAYIASDTGYVEEIVNMQMASHAYGANIAVIKTWDEMMEQMTAMVKKES